MKRGTTGYIITGILILSLLVLLSCAGAAEENDASSLRSKAWDAGLKLPTPKEGERLYLGVSDVPGTKQTRLFLALIAAPNGMSVRRVTLYGEALEVPQEGRSPWLINHESYSSEEKWLLLDAVGTRDLIFDSEAGKGVFDLRLDAEGGSCRVVVAGRCEKPKDDVNGEFREEAELTLLNLTGDIPAKPVDPPTREEAEKAGVKLPVPSAGETLYIGRANISQAEALYVAFVRTSDGERMKGLTVAAQNIVIEYRVGNKKVTHNSTNLSTTVNGALKIDKTITSGNIALSRFSVDGDGAEGVLRYQLRDSDDDVTYPFDPAWVRFARIE